MRKLPKIKRVRPVGDYRLDITFDDGAHGVHDLAWVFDIVGEMNAPLQEQAFFARVFLENGALAWPNGFDLSPWNIKRRMEEAGELQSAAMPAK